MVWATSENAKALLESGVSIKTRAVSLQKNRWEDGVGMYIPQEIVHKYILNKTSYALYKTCKAFAAWRLLSLHLQFSGKCYYCIKITLLLKHCIINLKSILRLFPPPLM